MNNLKKIKKMTVDEYITRLEEENIKLKEELFEVKMHFNNLLIEIVNEEPWDGEIKCDGKTPLDILRELKIKANKNSKGAWVPIGNLAKTIINKVFKRKL
jgi:hypothetical protein